MTGTHRDGDAEPGGGNIEAFGTILSSPDHVAAATGTGQVVRLDHRLPAREVCRDVCREVCRDVFRDAPDHAPPPPRVSCAPAIAVSLANVSRTIGAHWRARGPSAPIGAPAKASSG